MKQIVTHETSVNDGLSFSKITFRTKRKNHGKRTKHIEGDVKNFLSDCEEISPYVLEKNSKSSIYLTNKYDDHAFPPEISSLNGNTEKNLMETNTPNKNIYENKTDTKLLKRKHKNQKSRHVNETEKTEDICKDKDELPDNISKKTNSLRNDVTPRSNTYNSIHQTERKDNIVDNSFGSYLPASSKKKKKRKHDVVVDNYINCNQSECSINDKTKEMNSCEDDIVKLNKPSNKNNLTKINENKSIGKKNESSYHKSARDYQEIIIKNDKPELLVVQPNEKKVMIPHDSSFNQLHDTIGKKNKETFDDDTLESTVIKTKKKRKSKDVIFSDEESLSITHSNCKNNLVEDKEIIVRHCHKYPNVKHNKKKLVNHCFNIIPNIVPPESYPNLHDSNIIHKIRHEKPGNENDFINNSLLEKSLNDAKGMEKNSTKISSSKIKALQTELIPNNEENITDGSLDNSDEQIHNRVKKKQKKKRNECNVDSMAQILLSKAIENSATSSGTELRCSKIENSLSSSKNISPKLKKRSTHIHKVKHSIPHKHIDHKSHTLKHSETKNSIEKIQQALIDAALKNINFASKPKTPLHQKLSLENIKQKESNKKTIKHKSKTGISSVVDLEKKKLHLKNKKKKKEKLEISLEVITSRLLSEALKEKSTL